MDFLATLNNILIGLDLLEVIAILILTTAITMMLLTASVITQLLSLAGVIVVLIVFLFSSVSVRTGFIIFDGISSNAKINKQYIINRLLNIVKEEKKPLINKNLDDGSNISHYPSDVTLGRMKYSDEEAKNSLDKIYKNYGLDTIYYMQDVLLRAKKFASSDNAIYITLEDYAFMCSMNICDKYLYDFNAVKSSKGGSYLIIVLPEFLLTLENYVP